jgi:hypothetical protein
MIAKTKTKKPTEAVSLSEQVLAVLDAAAGSTNAAKWPKFSTGDGATSEYFGLRLIAVRSKTSSDWGIILERISGSFSAKKPTRVERFLYGSKIKPGHGKETKINFVLDRTPAKGQGLPLEINGALVKGPAGDVMLSDALVKKHGIKAGYSCESGGDDGYNLRLATYLAVHPNAYWEPAKITELKVPDAEVIVDTTAFEHVEGATAAKKKATLPSKSAAYKSLADALAARNPKKFTPGKANLARQLHAKHRTSGE